MIPFRSAFLACLLAAAAAGEPSDPAATVAGWVKALQTNDLAATWDRLPETQRTAWSASLVAPPAPPADAAAPPRGPRGGGRMIDGPLRMLAEGDQAQNGGRILAATLAAFAGVIVVDGKAPPGPAPATPAFPAFMPRMVAAGALGGMLNSVLARGLETQQVAAIEAWAAAYAAWAKMAPLADEQRATAAQPHIQAFAAAVRAAPAGADARAVLAAWSAGLPKLKQALAVYGLDADAAFASAKIEAAPAAADGAVVVTVRFTAFGVEHSLPISMRAAHGGWEIAADSPALRWLRGAAGPGMMAGGQRRRQNGPAPADPPADAPTPGAPVGF